MDMKLANIIMKLISFGFLVLFTGGLSELRSCISHFVPDLRNQQCRSHLLWSFILRSRLECFISCYGDRRCFSFQYHQGTKQCQGHYKRLPNNDCKSTPDFQTYLMCGRGTSVGAKCMTNRECEGSHTLCTNQICLCHPGYQYSPRSHACVAQCEVYADTFEILPNLTTLEHDDYTAEYKTSPVECLGVCKQVTEFYCRAVDVLPQWKTCYLSSTPQMVAPKKNRNFNSFFSYQRECAP